MPTKRGKDLFLDYLVAREVPFLTGNPGSTEAPLIDRLHAHPQIKYILALHEGVAVGIAEAYALASGRIGVANLHVAPGLGNALGMIYNAFVGRTPLLVTAGQQDTRMRLRRPLLFHDLVAMAQPVTKWAVQAETADELPLLLHQAFQIALTPPTGPVFVGLPINVLEQATDQELIEIPQHALRTLPDPDGITTAAQMLLESQEPVIVFGDEVHRVGAQAELRMLAEFLGAPVWGTLISPGVGFPMTHPQYRGELPDNHESIRACLGKADVILLVGSDSFREVFHRSSCPWPEGARVIQLETDPAQLSYNYAADLGLAADIRNSLQRLLERLASRASRDFRAASEARCTRLSTMNAREVNDRREQLGRIWDRRPMSPACLMTTLREVLPQDTVVVSEALSAELEVMSLLDLREPGDFYGSRGGGIGQGLPGGVGVKLAHPDRPVVVLSGDGSALFSIQALWTAAHHNLPVLFIILNNRSYRILKGNLDRYRYFFDVSGPAGYPFMDLTEPEVDFVSLAAGFGVSGARIVSPERIGPAVAGALAAGRPYLLDVALEG